MIKTNFSMAIASIMRSKWRSFLTMLGIIVGVISVVMIFSLGEGIKHQVSSQLGDLGSDLVVVRSGKLINRDTDGGIASINWSAAFGQSTLTEQDYDSLKKLESLRAVAPLTPVLGVVESDSGTPVDANSVVLATTPQIRDVLNQDVESGEFFTTPDSNKNVVVLGPAVAAKLFGEDSPVGHTITIRGVPFIVRGVMPISKPSPLSIASSDFNQALFIPYPAAKALVGGSLPIREIHLKLASETNTKVAVAEINAAMLESHGRTEDFTVLEPKDFIGVVDKAFKLFTTFIGAVAAISLIVGGIGIMNVMLVSVSERTHEIGIRKAIGATNQQILGQFMVEALMLSFFGGLFGIIGSVLCGALIRYYTELKPVFVPQVIAVAVLTATGVGIVFGIAPAIKAARKDPIRALRGE